jgi:beta-mannosidase
MFFYLLERYNKPDSFDDLIYFTGLTQMECIRDATEHWRRNKGRCNGSLWWQYNDCWGAPSWSSVDWFGKWKPLMYGSREFNQPFTLSFEDRKNEVLVYLLNDTLQPKECVVECGVYRLDGSRIKSENISVAIGANSVKNVLTMSVKNVAKNNCYVLSRLICDGVVVVERTKVLLPERKLKLKNANIECKIDGNKIILKSDTFARQVFVDIKGQKAPLSENGFDLLPNEEKVIELSNGDSIIGSDVTVKCVNNVKCTYSNLQRFAFRLKFSLNPVNIANRVYYSVS